MLNKRNSFIEKREILNNGNKYNCYCIKADELKRITDLSIKDIDTILIKSGNLPISKTRRIKNGISHTYYIFPIELIIAYFFEAETELLCRDN